MIKHQPFVLWLTGLPCSGKTTLANCIHIELKKLAIHSYCLDGDDLRSGISKDLGFSKEDRSENIRRAGEIARILLGAGIIPICSLISPFEKDRQFVRSLFKKGTFFEIFVDTPLEICRERDLKGFYDKAIKGLIKDFTGVSSPYEIPIDPEIILKGGEFPAEVLTGQVIKYFRDESNLQIFHPK